MRTVSTALAAYIASDAGTIWGADLHTFVLADKTVIRWSGSDRAIGWGSDIWQLGPKIDRSKLAYKTGLETDELTVRLMPELTDAIGSTSIRGMLSRGDFDGADYRLDRYFATADGSFTPLDVIPRFVGRVGTVKIFPGVIEVPIRSQLYLFDQPFPRNTYRPSCVNVLFDGACGLSKAALTITGTVSAVNARNWFNTGALASFPVGHFTFGRCRFTSGANAGRELQVSEDLHTGLKFAREWAAPLAVGDAFELSPGCDRKLTTCQSKFNNIVRFRGTPFIPSADTTA